MVNSITNLYGLNNASFVLCYVNLHPESDFYRISSYWRGIEIVIFKYTFKNCLKMLAIVLASNI